MKKGAILLLSILLICALVGPAIAQSENSKEWDILGIKIGDKIGDATTLLQNKFDNLEVQPNKGTYGNNTFRTGELTFGVVYKSNADTIKIACDLSDPDKVIAIWRSTDYFEKPSIDNIDKSLTEKYGTPFYQVKLGPWPGGEYKKHYCWFRNLSEKYKNHSNTWGQFQQLPDDYSWLATGGQYDRDNMPTDFGTFVACYVLFISNDLVSHVTCNYVDTVRVHNSCAYIKKVIDTATADAATKEKTKGDKVKTEF